VAASPTRGAQAAATLMDDPIPALLARAWEIADSIRPRSASISSSPSPGNYSHLKLQQLPDWETYKAAKAAAAKTSEATGTASTSSSTNAAKGTAAG
jgi:hypothetical protein